jgi:hypothetical protein
MNHFTQHVLAGIAKYTSPVEFDFKTNDELFNNPLLKHYREKDESFVDFEYCSSQQSIIAVSDSGYQWQVVGFASKPLIGLKEWKPKYRKGEGFNN